MNDIDFYKLFFALILGLFILNKEKINLSKKLLYENNFSTRILYVLIFFTVLDVLCFNLQLIYFILIIAVFFSSKFFYRLISIKRLSQKDYSELAFLLFRLALSLRSGADLISSLKEISTFNTYYSIRIKEILQRIDQGVDFQTASKISISNKVDPKYKQFILQLIITYNSGSSISKSVEDIAESASEHYLDSIDREIAKLPVKATLPLLLIFSGSLTLMLIPPLVNLLSFSQEIIVK